MASISNNQAAWQLKEKDDHYEVSTGPDQSSPAADEIVIKVRYVAINPSEWKIREMPYVQLNYPHVFGSDVAGEVVLVGRKVKAFKVGDRVIGHCLGLSYGGAKHGGFQQYTILRERVASRIPDNVDFSDAVVIPLAASTSIAALFGDLALDLPGSRRKEEIVLIWGASSSVGSIAVQMAKAAGYSVITTASSRNKAYAESLGADQVYDYADKDVVQQMVTALDGKKIAGTFDCIGEEVSTRACADIIAVYGGGKIASVLWPPSGLPSNVQAKLTLATDPGLHYDYPAAAVWSEWIAAALSNGTLLPRPKPFVLEGGLDRIDEALALQKKGVSASKIIVHIQ